MKAIPAASRQTKVVAKAKRRGFTADYKHGLLYEVDQAAASGVVFAVGAARIPTADFRPASGYR